MKLRKTIIGFVSLISVGAMFTASTSTVDAGSDDWYYPALGKAEDMPTKPKSSQAPKSKKSVKHKKVSKKHIKKHSKKRAKKNSRNHTKHAKKIAKS